MPIRGQYHTQLHNISIDLPSHLFDDDKPVLNHEVTHYYLSHYTNEGAVMSILDENCLPPKKLVVEKIKTDEARKRLHDDMYDPQEGFAHLMQAFNIHDKGGDAAIKDWEDLLLNKPKAAFSYLKYALKLSGERRDAFTGKLSNISLNTNIFSEVIKDPNFLLTDELEKYLKEENNSSKMRFWKACRAVERNNDLLDLSEEEICAKIGLSYYPNLSNKERAELINAITKFTDSPASAKESDIRSLSGAIEALAPAFQSFILMDANLVADARVGLSADGILDEGKYLRTIFVYNNPESPQKDNHFGFYSFSRKRHIINGSLEINDASKDLLSKNITKIVDAHSVNYANYGLVPERSFINPDIVWHKNYPDLIPFIQMSEKLGLIIEKNSFAFTDGHSYRFYLLRVKGSNLLHILAGHPFVEGKLLDAKFKQETVDFFEIIKGKEQHINNLFHDMLGIPYLLDVVAMARSAEEHLKFAQNVKDNGMERNDKCICGSNKKYKKCHGF